MSYFGIPIRNGASIGLGSIAPLLSRSRPAPTLDLNFLSEVLSPQVTFSRTSNATLFDSAGNLVYAPHNLLTFSEQFDNSAWTKVRSSITANATTAPDGTTTADKLVIDTTAATNHSAGENQSVISDTPYTLSVYAKAGEITQINLRFNAQFPAGSTFFDLSAGTKTNSGAIVDSTITPVGNGWYRCSITQTANASGTAQSQVFLAVAGSITIATANGTDGVFLWGAQLNVGALQPYYSTTVKNQTGYSQAFDNAAWTKTRSSISVTKVVAPDGSLTGQSLVEDTTASSTHDLVVSSAFVAGTPATLSIYAKSNGRNLRVFLPTAAFTVSVSVVFDLAAGTTSVATGTPIATIQNVGNGWYRCGLTATPTTTASGSITFRMLDGSTASYTGDGTSGIFIWGAQLSDSASLDPYVYNPVAAPSNVAYYGPRFDYDPTTLAPLGLLIEEQRTNSLRNSTGVGAVVGTPGTAPTNWFITGTSSGITREITAIGVEDGINYIDVRFFGTASATLNHTLSTDTATQIAASSGQSWSGSFYARLVAGSLNDLTVTTRLSSRDSGGAALETIGTITLTPTSAALKTQRAVSSGTVLNVSTAYILQQLLFAYNSGAVIDATFRIGLPQLELGAFATSVIPTTTAATTRTADVATMIGDNFSNWYNQSEGTFYSVWVLGGDNTAVAVYQADDGTSANLIRNRYAAAGTSNDNVVLVSTVSQASLSVTSNLTLYTKYKNAMAYKANDFARSSNGDVVITDTVGSVPTALTRLVIGNDNASSYLGGHIQNISYYPRRLSNAQLQALTV
jgi:hypothetical protein